MDRALGELVVHPDFFFDRRDQIVVDLHDLGLSLFLFGLLLLELPLLILDQLGLSLSQFPFEVHHLVLAARGIVLHLDGLLLLALVEAGIGLVEKGWESPLLLRRLLDLFERL